MALLNVLAATAAVAVIGELGIPDVLLTTAALSGLGTQVLAAAIGYGLGERATPRKAS